MRGGAEGGRVRTEGDGGGWRGMERWGDGVGDGGLCRQLLRRPLPLSAQALPSRPALDREARRSPRPAPEREADRPLTPCAPGHHGYTHFTLPRTVTESAHEPPLLAGRLQSQVHSTAWVRARARPAPAHTRAAGTAPGARGPRSAWRRFHSLRSVRPRRTGLFNSSRYQDVESPARTGGPVGQ